MVEGLEASVDELQEQARLINQKINDTIIRGTKMLKGNGFIVIVPSAPRLDLVEEHPLKEDAEAEASDKAYQHGTAIIYAPIAVIRPKRETVTSTPSKLLQQMTAQRQVGAGDTETRPPVGEKEG